MNPNHNQLKLENLIATVYSQARASTLIGCKFAATFSEKKVHCSQVSKGKKTD